MLQVHESDRDRMKSQDRSLVDVTPQSKTAGSKIAASAASRRSAKSGWDGMRAMGAKEKKELCLPLQSTMTTYECVVLAIVLDVLAQRSGSMIKMGEGGRGSKAG